MESRIIPRLDVDTPLEAFVGHVKRLGLKHRLRRNRYGQPSSLTVWDYPFGTFRGMIGLSSSLDPGTARAAVRELQGVSAKRDEED
jgi:hypothetical protein